MEYLRWLCWKQDCGLSFDERWVFAICCDLWFRQKKLPSVRAVIDVGRVCYGVAKRAMAKLVEVGLLDEKGIPHYREGIFYERANFIMKKWWRGLQYRRVTELSWPKRHALVHGWICWSNGKRKKVGPTYLATVTGLPKRTIYDIVDDMVTKDRLRIKDGQLVAMVKDGDQIVTQTDYTFSLIKTMLQDVHPPETRLQLGRFGMNHYSAFKRSYDYLKGRGRDQFSGPRLINLIKEQNPSAWAAMFS